MEPPPRVVIAQGRFVLGNRLGGGAFGEVYTCTAVKPRETETIEEFAVKIEPVKSPHAAQLHHEAYVYSALSRPSVMVGIPKVRWFGQEGDFNILVMELLGPSLVDLMAHCGGRFDGKSTMMLAHQAVSRLQYVHACGYLHRDLKPDNLAMGLGKRSHHLYLLDFGLSKKYRDHSGHIPFRDGKSLTGTARYVSIATHQGHQQSRKDDLESLAHVVIYLVRGNLPWQTVHARTKEEKFDKIKYAKINTSPSQLCSKLPVAFEKFLVYARGLGFADEPDYEHCRKFFEANLKDMDASFDYRYKWVRPTPAEGTESLSCSMKSGSDASAKPQSARSTAKSASQSAGGSYAAAGWGKVRDQIRSRHQFAGRYSPAHGKQGKAAPLDESGDVLNLLAGGV